MVRNILLSVLAGLLVPLIFWIGGYEFERGGIGAICFIYTIVVSVVTYYGLRVGEQT